VPNALHALGLKILADSLGKFLLGGSVLGQEFYLYEFVIAQGAGEFQLDVFAQAFLGD
jgi:hypothetical protein